MNGADRVTIDGSIGGTGTDRSLTITDTNTGTTSGVIQLQTNGADGAANNTLKNLIVVGNSNTTTTLVGIGSGSAGVGSLEPTTTTPASRTATSARSSSASSCRVRAWRTSTGTVITRNLLNSTAADSIGKGGIVVAHDDGAQITENIIGGIVSATSNDAFGISLGGLVGWLNTTATGGSEVTNATVSRNSIGAVQQTTTFSATGIIVTPTTTGTNLIANNFISGVISNGTSSNCARASSSSTAAPTRRRASTPTRSR